MKGRMEGRKVSGAAPALVAALALIACEPENESDRTDIGVRGTSGAAAAAPDDPGADITLYDGRPYRIYPDGKVDQATWLGSRLYGNICFHCHGDKGNGSSFAPSLHDSLKTMSYDDFVSIVAKGVTNVGASSTSVMPAYSENKTVMENVNGIYAYLKAASDNALPPGDLERKEPEDK